MKSKKKLTLMQIASLVKDYVVLRRKFFYVMIAFIAIVTVALFGTKIYLAFNLLIGHDSLVRLTASEQDLFLANSEFSEIDFSTYVSSNPFCKSVCEYTLRDLSNGEVLDKGNFSTIIINPASNTYTFYAPDKGVGQKLYRFAASCSSNKSSFCKTTEREIEKSFVVSLNYNLSEEQVSLREEAVSKLNWAIENYDYLNEVYLENLYLYNLLRERVLVANLNESDLPLMEAWLNKSLSDFENYDYDFVLLNKALSFPNETLVNDNVRLRAEVDKYNELVFLVGDIRERLTRLTLASNMNESNAHDISVLIQEYSGLLDSLNSSYVLNDKFAEAKVLASKVDAVFLDGSSENVFAFENVASFSPGFLLVSFNGNYSSNFSIPIERPICNYNGVREYCCGAECVDDSDKYPVILLHGHSFNSAISAEKSLGDLQEIRGSLFADGFLDGGDLILRSASDLETFKRTQKRIVFSVSYYFDIYKNSDETIVLETQSDNLDSYALRLSEIIDEVKLETGKDKVVIVAHSMGGLVARKYLQVFGDDDVLELIMIGTPNHGISGKTLTVCPILGENKHCADMDSSSLFLNKLNNGDVPGIPVKNIVGLGCDMQGENGDGVVRNSSAYLSWADNYYVNGTCDGFEYLHNHLVFPDEYPEVYDLVKEFLEEAN